MNVYLCIHTLINKNAVDFHTWHLKYFINSTNRCPFLKGCLLSAKIFIILITAVTGLIKTILSRRVHPSGRDKNKYKSNK